MRETLERRIDQAMGRMAADLVVRNARILDLVTCPLKSGPGLMLGLAVFEEAGDGKAASHSRGDYRQVA